MFFHGALNIALLSTVRRTSSCLKLRSLPFSSPMIFPLSSRQLRTLLLTMPLPTIFYFLLSSNSRYFNIYTMPSLMAILAFTRSFLFSPIRSGGLSQKGCYGLCQGLKICTVSKSARNKPMAHIYCNLHLKIFEPILSWILLLTWLTSRAILSFWKWWTTLVAWLTLWNYPSCLLQNNCPLFNTSGHQALCCYSNPPLGLLFSVGN